MPSQKNMVLVNYWRLYINTIKLSKELNVFDEKTMQKLGFYVYLLKDPLEKMPKILEKQKKVCVLKE